MLRLEHSRLRVDFVRPAPQAAAHHLLAQKLQCEGSKPYDVRDRLAIPALGEHANGDDLLNLLNQLSRLAHRVPGLLQGFRLLRLGQF